MLYGCVYRVAILHSTQSLKIVIQKTGNAKIIMDYFNIHSSIHIVMEQ